MKLVIIESPYAGDVERNIEYAKSCMADSIVRGEAPYASHLLLTQVVDDADPEQRWLGINIGLAWGSKADLTAVYCDHGVSPGMQEGIARARREGRKIVYRTLRDD
jgi:hypothetical protein